MTSSPVLKYRHPSCQVSLYIFPTGHRTSDDDFSSDAAKGVCIMILAAGVMSMNDAVSKYLVESYPIGQILCLRQVVALLVILLYVWRSGGWQDLRINDRAGHALRAILHVGGAALIVWALGNLPIATVTAIVFSSPIVVLIFSMHLLGNASPGFAGSRSDRLRGCACDHPPRRRRLPLGAAHPRCRGGRQRAARCDDPPSVADGHIDFLLFWASTLMVAVALSPYPLAGGR